MKPKKKRKLRNPIHFAIITSGTHMNLTKTKREKKEQEDKKQKMKGWSEE